jgi:CheY-like chemotaxis protein
MSKILIIDDDDSVREELSERIRAMGLESEEADSLNAALKMLDEYVFDCVLLDLCIPIKFEGIARLEHGKHLLQRILSENGAPPVIIITAHSGSGHTRAVEMMEIGAKSFVSKPFDKNPIEPKIAMVLSKNAGKYPALISQTKFKAGVLTLGDAGIELCGQLVGGVKGHACIRRIIEMLGKKTTDGQYWKISAYAIAEELQLSPSTIIGAIKDFRNVCRAKLGCGSNDVIQTHPGGGYQLCRWIEFQHEGTDASQLERDKRTVLRQIRNNAGRTRQRISDNTRIPMIRVRNALSALLEEKTISLIGCGVAATYSESKTKTRK